MPGFLTEKPKLYNFKKVKISKLKVRTLLICFRNITEFICYKFFLPSHTKFSALWFLDIKQTEVLELPPDMALYHFHISDIKQFLHRADSESHEDMQSNIMTISTEWPCMKQFPAKFLGMATKPKYAHHVRKIYV